jgi:nicotinamidase-related amidase
LLSPENPIIGIQYKGFESNRQKYIQTFAGHEQPGTVAGSIQRGGEPARMAALPDALDPDRTALLVVDAQNAFAASGSPLEEKGLDLSDPIDAVPRVRDAIDVARELGLTVAYSRSVRDPDQGDDPAERFDIVPDTARGGTICQAGDWDAAYVDGVDPRPGEYEVVKQGFDAFVGTDLDFYLRTEGVEAIVLCGFVSDVCVEGTARGAHERGYDLALVGDACASYTDRRHRTAVEFVESYLGTVEPLATVREALAAC